MQILSATHLESKESASRPTSTCIREFVTICVCVEKHKAHRSENLLKTLLHACVPTLAYKVQTDSRKIHFSVELPKPEINWLLHIILQNLPAAEIGRFSSRTSANK
jgi:hypothetical protein